MSTSYFKYKTGLHLEAIEGREAKINKNLLINADTLFNYNNEDIHLHAITNCTVREGTSADFYVTPAANGQFKFCVYSGDWDDPSSDFYYIAATAKYVVKYKDLGILELSTLITAGVDSHAQLNRSPKINQYSTFKPSGNAPWGFFEWLGYCHEQKQYDLQENGLYVNKSGLLLPKGESIAYTSDYFTTIPSGQSISFVSASDTTTFTKQSDGSWKVDVSNNASVDVIFSLDGENYTFHFVIFPRTDVLYIYMNGSNNYDTSINLTNTSYTIMANGDWQVDSTDCVMMKGGEETFPTISWSRSSGKNASGQIDLGTCGLETETWLDGEYATLHTWMSSNYGGITRQIDFSLTFGSSN